METMCGRVSCCALAACGRLTCTVLAFTIYIVLSMKNTKRKSMMSIIGTIMTSGSRTS